MSAPAPPWVEAWMLGPKSGGSKLKLYRFRPEPVDRFQPQYGTLLRIELQGKDGRWRRSYHFETLGCIEEAAHRAGVEFSFPKPIEVLPSADWALRINSFRIAVGDWAPIGGAK